jgi:hypothetical protein
VSEESELAHPQAGGGMTHERPVSVWICAVLSLLALTGFVGHNDQPQAKLHVSPQTTRLKVGEVTTLDLMVAQVHGLYGIEVHLRFDPEAIEIVDADPTREGIQLDPGVLPTPDFVVQNQADNNAGIIDYAVTQLPPREPGGGTGVVARITLRAKQSSISDIQFQEFLLADTTGDNIDALTQAGQIRVHGYSPWILGAAGGIVAILAIGGIGFTLKKVK